MAKREDKAERFIQHPEPLQVLREFDQNAIVVVGRAEPAALERVINAYGSYPDYE